MKKFPVAPLAIADTVHVPLEVNVQMSFPPLVIIEPPVAVMIPVGTEIMTIPEPPDVADAVPEPPPPPPRLAVPLVAVPPFGLSPPVPPPPVPPVPPV